MDLGLFCLAGGNQVAEIGIDRLWGIPGFFCRGANKTRGHCANKTRKVQRRVKYLLCRR